MKKYKAINNEINCVLCKELISEGENIYLIDNNTVCLECTFFLLMNKIEEDVVIA